MFSYYNYGSYKYKVYKIHIIYEWWNQQDNKAVPKSIWRTEQLQQMKEECLNKITKLDTKLAGILQSNKTVTLGIIFSTRQKSFAFLSDKTLFTHR